MKSKGEKNKLKILLICIYVVLTVSGLVLMKIGGNPGNISTKDGNFNFSMSLISLGGFIAYIFSFLLFTRLVVMFDLSYISPITAGIIQVLTLICSYYIFKEDLNIYSIIGATLIIIGVVLINFKIPNNTSKNINNTYVNENIQKDIKKI